MTSLSGNHSSEMSFPAITENADGSQWLPTTWLPAPTETGNSSNQSCQHLPANPEYYSLAYRTVGSILVSAIFVVGLVGNVLVVAVVTRTRSMHTPTNWYLVSLAVADILLLVAAPLITLIEYHLLIDQWIFGRPCCSVTVFAQYLGVNVSSLSITAFTVERYVAICHPMNVQTTNTVRRARRVIVGLWLAGAVYSSPWLYLATTVPKYFSNDTTIWTCTFSLPRRMYLIYYMADLVIFYVVPLLTACVLYGLIARTLYSVTGPTRSSSGSIRSSIGTILGPGGTAGHRGSGGFVGNPGTVSGAAARARRSAFMRQQSSVSVASSHSSNSRLQVVKMLAVVVAMFASLWMPYRVYVVYNSFAMQRFEDRWFLMFCRLAVYANSAVNPILYNAMSGKFRSAFRDQLSCCFRYCDCYDNNRHRSRAIQMAINHVAYVNARVGAETNHGNNYSAAAPAAVIRRVVMETPSEKAHRVAAAAASSAAVAAATVSAASSFHSRRHDDVPRLSGTHVAEGDLDDVIGNRSLCEQNSLLLTTGQSGAGDSKRRYYTPDLERV